MQTAEALIAYAFRVPGLRRIEAEIDPDNQASAAALQRLGFTQEGLFGLLATEIKT